MLGRDSVAHGSEPSRNVEREDRMLIVPDSRIIAVHRIDEHAITIFGHGVYDGDFLVSPDASGPFAEALRELGRTNPRLTMDSGQVVWGCECWWGAEALLLASFARRGLPVITVSIDAVRQSQRGPRGDVLQRV